MRAGVGDGAAVRMAAAWDLLMEVLTRKSNESQWIWGSGHEKSTIFGGISVLLARGSAQRSRAGAWMLSITFLKNSKFLKFQLENSSAISDHFVSPNPRLCRIVNKIGFY